MKFKDFYLPLSSADRLEFAEQSGTTIGYCNQIAYAGKRIELGLADVFVSLSKGKLRIADLLLTDRAQRQHAIRQKKTTPKKKEKTK